MRFRFGRALIAGLVVGTVVLPGMHATPAGAFALTGCNVTADNSSADVTPPPTWSDGETARVRILRPVGDNCSRPTNGWPLIVHLHGSNTSRCDAGLPYASRTEMASWGYAVLSFTARGGPSPVWLGQMGCDRDTDAQDAFDDNGRDMGGARDRLDVSELITWAENNYTWGGSLPCASNCINDTKVGVTGFSYGGYRAWMAGIPSPYNPQFDSRVAAIAPHAAWAQFDNLSALTSNGAGTARPRAHSQTYLWMNNQGWGPAGDRSVASAALELERARYLNQSLPLNRFGSITLASPTTLNTVGQPQFAPSDVGKPITVAGAGTGGSLLRTTIAGFNTALPNQVTLAAPAQTAVVSSGRVAWGTQAFWDERYIHDDDPIVDKVSHITMPVFVSAGWLDDSVGIYNQQQIEAYNHLPATNTDKYLYLGSCGHNGGDGDPCHSGDPDGGGPEVPNRTHMQDALHRFFDKYLPYQSTTPVGGPVFSTIPPAWASAASNPWCPGSPGCSLPTTPQAWPKTETTTWPPSTGTTSTPLYFRNGGVLSTTVETYAGCTAGAAGVETSTGCSSLTNPKHPSLVADVCFKNSYDPTNEALSYTYTFPAGATKKVVGFEADLRMASDTTRLQIYVDMHVLDPVTGTPVRVWRGDAQIVPTERQGTGNIAAPTRFKFRPGGVAWSILGGQTLKVTIASNNTKSWMGPEPLPGTYRLYHNSDPNPSKLTLTFVS